MFEKVREIMVDNLGLDPSEISLDSNLQDDLDIDSLDEGPLHQLAQQVFNKEMIQTNISVLMFIRHACAPITSKAKSFFARNL